MTARVILVTTSPRDPATGAPIVQYLAGGGTRRHYVYQGRAWRAGVAARPRFKAAIGFDEAGWTGGVVPTTGTVRLAPSTREALKALNDLYWEGAPIRIETGSEPTGDDEPAWTVELVGTVAGHSSADGFITLTIGDLGIMLSKPLVPGLFAGTGGLEGGEEALGRVKRRSWGRIFNVEFRVFDKAYNVYECGDPMFALQAITALRDIGRFADPNPTLLAWQGSAAATLTALKASLPVKGSGVVAPSIAMAKWWTQPMLLTGDIRGEIGAGYVETAPEIAARVVAVAGGTSIDNVGAAVAIRGDVAGIHVDSATETTRQVLDRLLLGVSLFAYLQPSGTIRLLDFRWSDPVETLRVDGRSLTRTFPPIGTRRLGYQRAYRIHGDGEIASSILGAPVTWPDVTDPEGTKPADNATVGATVGVDLKAANGATLFPSEVLNEAIRLSPDGKLYQLNLTDPLAFPVSRGSIALPDLGAATEASRRQIDRAVDTLADAVLRLTSEASAARATFRDAGFYVDPASGTVRLFAVDQTASRIAQAEVRVAAAEVRLSASATTNYVNDAIALAAIDPSQVAELGPLQGRLTAAEIDIDGLQGSLALKADATTVGALGGRVTSAELTIDALTGTVSLKADSTTVIGLDVRVASAESSINALGDVSSLTRSATAARFAQASADDAGEASLRALLAGDDAARSRLIAIADAREELSGRILSDVAAEARLRVALGVEVADSRALIATETLARVDGQDALASQITAAQAAIGANTADLHAEVSARVTAVQAVATDLAALGVSFNGNVASVSAQLGVLVDADHALSVRIDTLSTSFSGNTATVNGQLGALVDADHALSLRIDVLGASFNGNTATVNGQLSALVDADHALSTRIDTLGASFSGNTATVSGQLGALVDADHALSLRIDALTSSTSGSFAGVTGQLSALTTAQGATAGSLLALTTTVGGHTATITTHGSSIDGLKLRQGVELDNNGYITGYVQNNSGTRGDFLILADRFAVGSPGNPSSIPFEVVDGTTYIKRATIRDASIDTLALRGHAVTIRAGVITAEDIPGAGGDVATVLSYSLTLPIAGDVIISMTGRHTYSGTPAASYGSQLVVDGVGYDGPAAGTGFAESSFADTFKLSLSADTHVIAGRWRGGSSGIVLKKLALVIDAAMR